jgi:uncharacterized membrane protein YcaP (DUF421 family)
MDTLASFLDVALGLSAVKAEELSTVQACVRAILVYLILIAYVRVGKKRFLSQATAFDAILVIIIGSVASRAISGTAPFFASLAAAFMLIVMHWIISYFTMDSKTLGDLTKGHDTLIIENGRTHRPGLRSAHMSNEDLAEDLRQQGVERPEEVKEARLERSGKLSVIKK